VVSCSVGMLRVSREYNRKEPVPIGELTVLPRNLQLAGVDCLLYTKLDYAKTPRAAVKAEEAPCLASGGGITVGCKDFCQKPQSEKSESLQDTRPMDVHLTEYASHGRVPYWRTSWACAS
jgi:hypothetical protein